MAADIFCSPDLAATPSVAIDTPYCPHLVLAISALTPSLIFLSFRLPTLLNPHSSFLLFSSLSSQRQSLHPFPQIAVPHIPSGGAEGPVPETRPNSKFPLAVSVSL